MYQLKRITLVLIVIMLITIPMESKKKKKKSSGNQIENKVEIEIDKVAFDENSLFGIYDEAGNLIVNFDRFENKNSKINSFKIFNDKKEHIYTIVADDIEQTVSIMSKDGKRGKLSLKVGLSGMNIKMTAEVKYFGKPYDLLIEMDFGMGSFSSDYIVTYESKPIMKESISASLSGDSEKKVYVDKTFLDANKIDCAIWALSLLAFDELAKEASKSNQM